MSPVPALPECDGSTVPLRSCQFLSEQPEPSGGLLAATVRHGRMAQNILLLSASSKRFASHVEAVESWWHHLAYLAIDIHGIRSTEEALYLGDLLAAAAASDICIEILGTKPTGLVAVLRKIRAYPLLPGYYEKLIEALNSAKRLKILVHSPVITPDLINVVSTLPEEVLSMKIVSAVENESQVESALYYFDALLKIFPPEDHQRIQQSLSNVRRFSHFEAWFGRWLEKSPPIEAPWAGNALLQPIHSAQELVATAKEFHNCLRSYVRAMVAGCYYFYRWLGGSSAVISLRKDAFFGWVVTRIEGPNNTRLPNSSEADILEQFRNAGIRHRPKDVADFLADDRFLI